MINFGTKLKTTIEFERVFQKDNFESQEPQGSTSDEEDVQNYSQIQQRVKLQSQNIKKSLDPKEQKVSNCSYLQLSPFSGQEKDFNESKSIKKSNIFQIKNKKDEIDSNELSIAQQEFIKKAEQFLPYFDMKDDYKSPNAYKKGGFVLKDEKILERLRSSASEVIKLIGRKFITGDFNLTTISFPIKCMSARSILQLCPTVQCVNALYLNYASSLNDPVERFKVFMTTNIAFLFDGHTFEKPLNPVIGETYQAISPDGARIYMEQTSHHPPVTHTLIEGPQGRYRVSGWNEANVKFSMNSVTIYQRGHRKVQFHDGQVIECNLPTDTFGNALIGNLHQQVSGKVEFFDKENDIKGYYEIGKVKNQSQEYFEGYITHKTKKVCSVYGNYCGYIDFGGVRYFDHRLISDIWQNYEDVENPLPSDSSNRQDLIHLNQNNIDEAQSIKDQIEIAQRKDRKLREAAEKRRKGKGPKIIQKY